MLSRQLASSLQVEAWLSYVVPPRCGEILGLDVDAMAEASGLPAFSFRRQHGSWPLRLEPSIDKSRFTRDSVVPSRQTVRSARGLASSLNTLGFELRESSIPIELVDDDHFVESVCYEDVCRLVKLATGARVVKPYDHVRRDAAIHKTSGFGPPAFLVHTDSADRSWQWRTDELLASGLWDKLGPTNIDEDFARQYMSGGRKWSIVNYWRHVGDEPILRTTPLALLDDASVDWDQDVMLYPMTMQGCVAFNYVLLYSPLHRWFYFPRMTHDEVLLFTAFACDSGDTRPRVLFHTAFDLDLPAGEQPLARKSLEVRCVACDFDD